MAILILCAPSRVAVYYFDTSDQLGRLRAEEGKELQLRTTFESKQAKAANLECLRTAARGDEGVLRCHAAPTP